MCFGVIDIIFIVSICLSLFGTPDYSVIIDKMDSIERERKIQVDSLMEEGISIGLNRKETGRDLYTIG